MEENNKILMEIEEPKKKGKLVPILIVILFFACCGMGTFIYLNRDKLLEKPEDVVEEKEENNDEVKEEREELSIQDDVVVKLYNIFKYDNRCYITTEGLNHDNKTKLRIAYENVGSGSFEKIQCDKVETRIGKISHCGEGIPNESVEAYASGDMQKFDEYIKQVSTDSIKASILKSKVLELFGKDYNYKNEDFGLDAGVEPVCLIAHYDQNHDLYAKYTCEGGGTCGGFQQELKSAYKEGNGLWIQTHLKEHKANGEIKEVELIYQFQKENENYVFVSATEE